MSVPWHCRQIPNGAEPIVVCEREDLHRRIAELEAKRDRYRDALATLTAAVETWRSGGCLTECDCDACDEVCFTADQGIDLLRAEGATP